MTMIIELAGMDLKTPVITIFYIFKKPEERLDILSRDIEEHPGKT